MGSEIDGVKLYLHSIYFYFVLACVKLKKMKLKFLLNGIVLIQQNCILFTHYNKTKR